MHKAIIRTARKPHRCVNAGAAERGNPAVATCKRRIMPAERYVQGDPDPYEAGGFGYDKICMACHERGAA